MVKLMGVDFNARYCILWRKQASWIKENTKAFYTYIMLGLVGIIYRVRLDRPG